MRKKSVVSHVMKRDNVFYYVRHVPKDLIDHYNVKRLCFSLKRKCESLASRSYTSNSFNFLRIKGLSGTKIDIFQQMLLD